jgi:hypothetical protein
VSEGSFFTNFMVLFSRYSSGWYRKASCVTLDSEFIAPIEVPQIHGDFLFVDGTD